MSKPLLLLGGAILLGVSLLIAVLWGWLTLLTLFIGLFLFGLMVLGTMGVYKLYLKTFAFRTLLYTHPFSAMLYSVVDPHRRNQSSDLNALFPSEKRRTSQEPEDELPPFHFKDAGEEDQKCTTSGDESECHALSSAQLVPQDAPASAPAPTTQRDHSKQSKEPSAKSPSDT